VIRVVKEDVLYNWTNSSTIQFQILGNHFRVGKEMHPLTLEALIGACSKLESFVIDFATSTSMYYYKHYIVPMDFHP